jgi:predicted short-subunit dehydrogenase-like oxidoreductase (DUF2520 family)
MKKNSIDTIVLIGAGNVATHLAAAFKDTGRRILQVYSRSETSAKQLAGNIGVAWCCDLKNIIQDADLYIISVTDGAIENIAKEMKTNGCMVVHTSGFKPMAVIKDVSENYGVFYPLQTFSKNKSLDYLSIPVCIEANNDDNLKLLEDLARSFTTDVRLINSEQRKIIHLAAVFTSNFTNAMYDVAEEILLKGDIPFDILKPLIRETADKVMFLNPTEAQTGPARRMDTGTMHEHLSMLENDDYRELYQKISSLIQKKYQ